MSDSSWKTKTALFLSSQTLSLFGSSLVQYALMWYVTLETKSGVAMTLYVLCGFVPTFLLSPFAGVWADRLDRKKLIMVSDSLIALATLGLAVLFFTGDKELWLVLLTAAVRALGTAVQTPAVGALVPQFVPADQLARVNGFQSSIQSGVMFAAPVAAGAWMSVWPIEGLFLIDVATAAVAVAILGFFLRIPPHEKAAQPAGVSYFHDLKLGFLYLRDHRYLVPFFTFVGILLLLVAPAAFLTPLQVARTFGGEVWRLTAIEIVFSLGMMAGGLIMAATGGFRNRIHTMIFAGAVMAVCTILLSAMPNFWIYLIPMGVFGIAMPFYNSGATVLIQEHVEEQFLGRVFSIFTMLMTSMMPLGMLIFGPLAEVVSVETLLWTTGAAMLALTLGMLLHRRLVAAGLPAAKGTSSPEE